MVEPQIEVLNQASSKRRFFKKRWAIRLFLVLLIIAAAFGWASFKQQTRQDAKLHLEKKKITLVQAQYGWAWYRNLTTKWPLPKFERVMGFQRQISTTSVLGQFYPVADLTDDDWAALTQFSYITYWSMRFTNITDKDLTRIVQHFPNLKNFYIHRNSVTKEGWPHLASLEKLEHLGLSDANLTDDDLAHLAALPLLGLTLSNNSQLTDDGLSHLTTLPLLSLTLNNNSQLTDAGLTHLAPLTKLQTLLLYGTKMTQAKTTQLLPWVKQLGAGGPIPRR